MTRHQYDPNQKKLSREKCERVWAILQELHAQQDWEKISQLHSVAETITGSQFILAQNAFSPRSRE